MKRKLILFTLFILTISLIIFVAHKMGTQEIVSVKTLNRAENNIEQSNFSVLGKIANISLDSFTISDIDFLEDELVYYFEENKLDLDGYSIGNLVLVETSRNKETSTVQAKGIEKIPEKQALIHLAKTRPLIEISVIDYSGEGVFKLNLKNTGILSINYSDLYDEKFGYSLIYKLNNTQYSFHPLEDFETLKPGEEKTVEFLLDYENMEQETNYIQFIWGKKSLYADEFTTLSSSETFQFKL